MLKIGRWLFIALFLHRVTVDADQTETSTVDSVATAIATTPPTSRGNATSKTLEEFAEGDFVITKCPSVSSNDTSFNSTDETSIDSTLIKLLRDQHHQIAVFAAYNSEYRIVDNEICALGVDIGVPNAELSGEDEAAFYKKTISNMREMMPRLRSLDLRGFYIHHPGQNTTWSFAEEAKLLKRQFLAIISALHNSKIGVGAFSHKTMFYVDTENYKPSDYAHVIKTTFNGSLVRNLSTPVSDYYSFNATINDNSSDQSIHIDMLTATYVLSTERVGSLAKLVPAGRSNSRIRFLNAVGIILTDAYLEQAAGNTTSIIDSSLPDIAQHTNSIGLAISGNSSSL